MASFESMLNDLAATRARYEDREALRLSTDERIALRVHLHELRATIRHPEGE